MLLGTPPNICLWLLSFLIERQQYVETNIEKSKICVTNTGTPQGCVLSSYLFICYTKCMNSKNLGNTKMIKYADDTVILGLIKNIDEKNI